MIRSLFLDCLEIIKVLFVDSSSTRSTASGEKKNQQKSRETNVRDKRMAEKEGEEIEQIYKMIS